MKKTFTLLLIAAASLVVQGKVYTLADLAGIEGSGVSVADGVYTLSLNTELTEDVVLDDGGIVASKSDLTLADGNGLTINAGETLVFTGKARISMNGPLVITDATVTADEASTGSAMGFKLYGEQSNAVLNNVVMNYVGINFGANGGEGNLVARNCIFDSFNSKLGSANVNITSDCCGNVVDNCKFTNGQVACIASAASVAVGIDITNNIMDKNGVSGRLTPAINMGLYGSYDIRIENNEVTGRAVVTRTGGIAVSHLLGAASTGTVTVKGNTVTDNSYGITLTGPGKIFIENNVVKNNRYFANAQQGGSGINITANTGGAVAKIRGNQIEGNMWGITLIGPITGSESTPLIEVDMGTNEDPGLNTFKDNGNDGTNYSLEAGNLCDLYNNSGSNISAIGNTWNVADQNDAAAIEQVIVHQSDNGQYGKVDFGKVTGIDEVKTVTDSDGTYFDLLGRPVAHPAGGIYVRGGKKVIVR